MNLSFQVYPAMTKTTERVPAALSRRDLLRAGLAAPLSGFLGEEVGLPPLPHERSSVIKGIRWLTPPLHGRDNGDVWTSTWADDDHLYSVADDTAGTGQVAWNLSVYRVQGTPSRHAVTRVNEMKEYGEQLSGHWWKGAGLVSIDGVLYLGIYSQSNPGEKSATAISFNAGHSSIIKSVDHGRTWTPVASWEKPMFPGKQFPTPFFVQYGKDYAGAIDDYVYLVSNDGGWNNWDRMFLARVPRRRMGELNRAHWEFFSGMSHRSTPSWTRDVLRAAPVFEHKGFTSMTGIQYVPLIDRFILGQWAYVSMAGGGDQVKPSARRPPWPPERKYEQSDQTMLCLYEAAKPWGPWRLFHAQPKWGPAFYNPGFPSKWFSEGGRKMWIVEGGNYRGPDRASGYTFTVQQLELVL